MVDQEPTEDSEPVGDKTDSAVQAFQDSVANAESLATRNTELEDRELVSVAVITRLTSELKEVKLKLKIKSKRKT